MAGRSGISRRSLTSEMAAALDKLITAEAALSNAYRLMSDASYLIEGRRYASAVALAVISLEEIGKYLLAMWSKNPEFAFDRRRLHEAKQRAIAALFMADRMRAEYQKRKVDFSDLGSPEKMAILVEAIKAGHENESGYAAAVRAGVIQHVKHSGLYFDNMLAEKGIEPSRITANNADGLMRDCSRAFMILVDRKAVSIAADLFMILLRQK